MLVIKDFFCQFLQFSCGQNLVTKIIWQKLCDQNLLTKFFFNKIIYFLSFFWKEQFDTLDKRCDVLRAAFCNSRDVYVEKITDMIVSDLILPAQSHCTVVHYTEQKCSELHCIELHYTLIHYTAGDFNPTAHCTALHYDEPRNTLQNWLICGCSPLIQILLRGYSNDWIRGKPSQDEKLLWACRILRSVLLSAAAIGVQPVLIIEVGIHWRQVKVIKSHLTLSGSSRILAKQ